jgi:hypothetical protein
MLSLVWLASLAGPHLAGTEVAASDEVKWRRVNIPAEGDAGDWMLADGSDVKHLAAAPDGAIYAHVAGPAHTLYRSNDEGRTWSYLDVQDDIVAIAIAPDKENTVYYATS